MHSKYNTQNNASKWTAHHSKAKGNAAPIYNQWDNTMKQLQKQKTMEHNTKMETYSLNL